MPSTSSLWTRSGACSKSKAVPATPVMRSSAALANSTPPSSPQITTTSGDSRSTARKRDSESRSSCSTLRRASALRSTSAMTTSGSIRSGDGSRPSRRQTTNKHGGDPLVAPQRHDAERTHVERAQQAARRVRRRREVGEPGDDERHPDPMEVLGEPREGREREAFGDRGPVRDRRVVPLRGAQQRPVVGRHLEQRRRVGFEERPDRTDGLGQPPLVGRRLEQVAGDLAHESLGLGPRVADRIRAQGPPDPRAPQPFTREHGRGRRGRLDRLGGLPGRSPWPSVPNRDRVRPPGDRVDPIMPPTRPILHDRTLRIADFSLRGPNSAVRGPPCAQCEVGSVAAGQR